MAKIIGMKEKEIKEFLSNDVVELSAFPIKEASKRFYKVVIDFASIKNNVSRQQFRDLLFSIFCYEAPYKRASDRIYYVLRLAGFMSDLNGITEIPDKELKTFLTGTVMKIIIMKTAEKSSFPAKMPFLKCTTQEKAMKEIHGTNTYSNCQTSE